MIKNNTPKLLLLLLGLLSILAGCEGRDDNGQGEIDKYFQVNTNMNYQVLPNSSISNVAELVKEYDQNGNIVNSESMKFSILYTVTPELLKEYSKNANVSNISIVHTIPKGITILNPEIGDIERLSNGTKISIPLSNFSFSASTHSKSLRMPEEPNIPQTFKFNQTSYTLNGVYQFNGSTQFKGETKLENENSHLLVNGQAKFDGNLTVKKENSSITINGDSLFNGETRLIKENSKITVNGNSKYNGNLNIEEQNSIVSITGDSIFNGETWIKKENSGLFVGGNSKFDGNTWIQKENSLITVLGDALLNGETRIQKENSSFLILGNAKFNGNISLEKGYSHITVNGDAEFNGNVDLRGNTFICVRGTAYYSGDQPPFKNRCGQMKRGQMSSGGSHFTPQSQSVALQLQVDRAIDEPLQNAELKFIIETENNNTYEKEISIPAPSDHIRMIVRLKDDNRQIVYEGNHQGEISKQTSTEQDAIIEEIVDNPISEMKFLDRDAKTIIVKDMNNKEKVVYLTPQVAIETDQVTKIDPEQTEPYQINKPDFKLFIDPEKKIIPADEVSYRYSIDDKEEQKLDDQTMIRLTDDEAHSITVFATGGFALEDSPVTFQVQCRGLLNSLTFISGIDTTILVGEKLYLGDKIVFNPEDYPDKDVSWASSNNAVATIDSNGNVTGVLPGKTIITVLSKDGNHSDTLEIEVLPYIGLQGVPKYLYLTSSIDLNQYLIRKPAETPITWKSSNSSVISINNDGVIVGKAIGFSDITVTSVESGMSSTVRIYVKSKTNSDSPSLDLKW